MKPTTFKEVNRNLTKPEGMTDEECGTLPTFTDGKQCISLWKMSFKERLQILFFGRIWIGIISGYTQPPIWLDASKTVFGEANSTGLTWFNLSPEFYKIGKFNVKLFNLFCRFTKCSGKHFGFGVLQISSYHLFYIGRQDNVLKLSILFTNFMFSIFNKKKSNEKSWNVG